MEMLIIAVVAVIAFAFVLVPLFRRTPRGEGQPDEFAGDAEAAARPAGPARPDAAAAKAGDTDPADVDPVRGRGVVPPMAAGPVTPVDAAGTTALPDDATSSPTPAAGTGAGINAGTDDVELEVQRYRAALRAGTLCRKCGQANPADSRFCFDCGAALPLAEAREFD